MRITGEYDVHRRTHGTRMCWGSAAPGASGALAAVASPERPATELTRTPAALVSIVQSLLLATLLCSIATATVADTWRVNEFDVDVHAREGPGEDYAIVETLRYGEDVEALERVGDWTASERRKATWPSLPTVTWSGSSPPATGRPPGRRSGSSHLRLDIPNRYTTSLSVRTGEASSPALWTAPSGCGVRHPARCCGDVELPATTWRTCA